MLHPASIGKAASRRQNEARGTLLRRAFAEYLDAEKRLGRVTRDTDTDALATHSSRPSTTSCSPQPKARPTTRPPPRHQHGHRRHHPARRVRTSADTSPRQIKDPGGRECAYPHAWRRHSGRAEQERLRIARDLRDVVAHTLTTIKVQGDVAGHRADRVPGDSFSQRWPLIR